MAVEFRVDVPDPEHIETDEEAEELLDLLMCHVADYPEEFIGWDTETTGKKLPVKSKPLDALNDTITFWSLSAGFGEGEERYYRRWCLNREHFTYFSPLLENPRVNIAGWNLPYDAHIAWTCGVNVWNVRWPVNGLVLAKLHDENRRSHGLKQCAVDWLGLHMTPYKSLFAGVLDSAGKKAKEYVTSLLELAELGHMDKVADYASYDAYAHLRLVEWLKERLEETPVFGGGNLWQYFLDWERYVTRMLWFMEKRGMNLDLPYLKGQIPVIQERIDAVEQDVCRIAGEYVNIASPKQLSALLFGEDKMGLKPVKLTDTGQPSTDEEVMDVLTEAGIEIAAKIVEARKLNKTKSTYLDALITLAEYYDDNRIHPSFNQLGARTGRFSTKHPNSQNFPRPDGDEWGIRAAFIPSEGFDLLVADYEQIEMRIMADRANDKKMLQAIKEGKDIHSFTVATMVEGVEYEEVVAAKKAEHPNERQKWLKKKRQDMKAVGFGIIYGAGPPRISESIEISDADWHDAINQMDDETFNRRVTRAMKRNELLSKEKAVMQVGKFSVAAHKIQEYFDAFPGVKGFMKSTPNMCRHTMYYDEENQEREWDFEEDRNGWGNNKALSDSGHAKKFGYVNTLAGRYRRLEDIDHRNYFFKSEAERQAVNTRIQGSAADITVAAMLAIEYDEVCRELGVRILNQVHDEIVMEVPTENAEEAAPRVAYLMENPYGEDDPALSVPIPVDMKIVSRWAEAK
jgi:DNA polymerase-1